MAANKRFQPVGEGSSTASNYVDMVLIKKETDDSCSIESHYIEVNSISPEQKEKSHSRLSLQPPIPSRPILNNVTTKFDLDEKENFCDILSLQPPTPSRPIFNNVTTKFENNIVNTRTENEVWGKENKEISKLSVLEKYRNYFVLFFVIITVALHLGCFIFIATLNNEVRNEKQLQADLMIATKSEIDEINQKYDHLMMEFINQQNYSNENLKKLNNTMNNNIQELDNVISDINQLNQSSINQSLTIYQLQQQLDEFNVSMQEFKSDNNKDLNSINEELVNLTNNQNALKVFTNTSLQQGYIVLENDWVTPFNGYKYKLGLEFMDWNDSYLACQSLGGNLASIGIQSVNVQIVLGQAMWAYASASKRAWIGLHNSVNETTWRWLSSSGNSNGVKASNGISLWPEHPKTVNFTSNGCAVLLFSNNRISPTNCYSTENFLCEKRL